MQVKKIGQWYVDFRLDIAYMPLDHIENGKQLVDVYEKRKKRRSLEYFSEDFIKGLYDSADKYSNRREIRWPDILSVIM